MSDRVQDLDQFTRRLLYAYHGHAPHAADDRLYCKPCGIEFGTASIAEIMAATRRLALALGAHQAAKVCPRCRRLERMLLIAAVYLSPGNWYESAETVKMLDRVKRHLAMRLQDILNRHLTARED